MPLIYSRTLFEVSQNYMDLCDWEKAKGLLQKCLNIRNEIAKDAPGGSTTTKGSIPVAEVLQAQAVNLHFNCEYVASAAKFLEAVKMRIDVMPAGT